MSLTAISLVPPLAEDGIDPKVAELAAQVKAAQAPEIETMTGWLEEWDEAVPPTTGMADVGDASGDGRDESEQDMAALGFATGDEAARLFLQQMTEHHRGAIGMAEQEVDGGSHPRPSPWPRGSSGPRRPRSTP